MLYLHSEQLNTTIAYQEERGIKSLTVIDLSEGNWHFNNFKVKSLEKAYELIPDQSSYKPVSQAFFEDRRLLFLTPIMVKANLLSIDEEPKLRKSKR